MAKSSKAQGKKQKYRKPGTACDKRKPKPWGVRLRLEEEQDNREVGNIIDNGSVVTVNKSYSKDLDCWNLKKDMK